MSAPSPPRVSAPFLDRELDGAVLLDEIHALRLAGVTQARLVACDRAVQPLERLPVHEAAALLRDVAVSQFGDVPTLAQLLVRWAPKLRLEGDVRVLRVHFRRLSLAAGLLNALWQAAARITPRRHA